MNVFKRIFNKDAKYFQFNILANDGHNFKIPDRYRIKKSVDGDLLTCVESPNITVKIKKNFVVSLTEAKKFPERSIFLDGAANGEPFLDNTKQIYNLDHHTGCERNFTLSTCEQALILVRKGLNLKEKNWTIYANEPDLDTIFAIWILLNHIHLSTGDSKQYRKIIPLIRLEGVIDALGLELTDIVGFPPNFYKEIKNKLDKLRLQELKFKHDGLWNQINEVEYTHRILNFIDTFAFESSDMEHLKSVVEVARAEISDDDSVVIFEGDLGIYELEEYLNKLYNKKPTIVILKKDHNTYTIRKGDMFRPIDLETIYQRLNLFDKNVDGKLKENRWGGSSQIGGSPRVTGTALTPNQIVEICKNAYYIPNRIEIIRVITNLLWIANIPNILSWFIIFIAISSSYFQNMLIIPMGIRIDIYYYFVILVLSYYSFLYLIHSPHFFGFRFPIGYKWIRWIILSIILGFLGGLWIPKEFFMNKNVYNFTISFIIGPIFTSILFFSFLHGILTFYFPVQRYEGKIFISKPTQYISFIYTLTSLLLPFYQFPFPTTYHDLTNLKYTLFRIPILYFYSVFICFTKERSESIYPVIITNIINYLLFLILYNYL